MKFKPDVIVAWPDNCDYPLWRKYIKENRDNFDKVIVVLTKTNQNTDLSKFAREKLEKIANVYNSPPLLPNQDWRDVAVNYALSKSESEWIWFTEQDFIVRDDFWEDITKKTENNDVISYYNSYRMHPCCIFVKRYVIELTTKYFGIVPDKLDHFGVFQQEIDELFTSEKIEMSMVDTMKCEHLNGLSSNWTLVTNGGLPNYQPNRFKMYIKECLSSGEKLDIQFEQICRQYLEI